MFRYRSPSIVLALLLLTACGGGGGSHAVPPAAAPAPSPTVNASSTARFTLTIPASTTSSTTRAPKYISANTQSVVITLISVNGHPFTGTSAETAANLNTSNPACTGSPLTCSIAVPAAAGTDVFTVSLYDAQQTSTSPATPAGNLLSTASVTITVTAGQNSAPATPLVLSGVPTTIVAAFATDAVTTQHVSGSVASGFSIVGNQPYTLTVSTEDASGATIVGNGLPTISSGSSAVAITNVSGTTYKLQVKSYSSTPVAITASTPAGTAPNFTVSTIPELWVAEASSGTIAAYALFPNCSPTACASIASDTITTLVFPFDVAFDPSGNLWASDDNTETINEFSQGTGPTPAPVANISSGLADPVGITFDSSGNLWAADDDNCIVLEYPPQNGATPTKTITGFNQPEDVAFDPSGNLWVADNGNDISEFNASTGAYAGESVSIVATLSFLTFDGSANLWLSANNAVKEYAAPVTSSSSIAASITNGVSGPFGVAFDPAGNLWIANNGTSTVTGYKPTNGASAFTTISLAGRPRGITITP